MGDATNIEWTDATWTPIRARYWEIQNDGSGKERIGWHCEHITEACRNCYAERMNLRLGTGLEFKPGHLFREEHVVYNNGQSKVFLDEKLLTQPLRWKKPRKIFVCSMTDLFADFVPTEMIEKIFGVIIKAKNHTFQILTKRPKRARAILSSEAFVRRALFCAFDGPAQTIWPLPNVWLGTSISNQEDADKFVPELLTTPAAKRFLSCEPMLGPIDIDCSSIDWMQYPNGNGISGNRLMIDWVICGGESGPNARPMHPDWARSLRDQCASADIPFFFKQWGEWSPGEHWPNLKARATADYFAGKWTFDRIPAGPSDDHVDDEPTLYRNGKRAGGRLLDGVDHNSFPKAAA